MAIVTVVGASGTTVQVTVDGGQAQSLAESYARQIQSAASSDDLTTSMFNSDVTTSSIASSTTSVLQAEITEGGSYTISGAYTNIVVGDAIVSGSDTTAVTGAATVNATGVTSSSLSVLVSDADGVTLQVGNQSGSFVAEQGNNLFDGSGKTGDWTIALGAGNNTVRGTDGNDYIYSGSGSNEIHLGSGSDTVVSQGTDTIDGASVTAATVSLLGGSSTVTLGAKAYVDDAASEGSNITLGSGSSVQGGSGSTVTFNGTGTVTGSSGDTISASGDLDVYYGSNQVVSTDGALKFISGTGNASITAGQGTIWGATGLDAVVNITSDAIFTANQTGSSSSEYVDASSSTGNVEFWTGAGSETLIGGSGADHFVFGTSYDDSTGDSYATVYGGTGAANTFGVLSGHTGGHIYIEDFGSVAGNMFFMYNYKPSDEASAIAALLETATVSGGNTTIQLDNDMQVTFVGVTDLKASNFVIS